MSERATEPDLEEELVEAELEVEADDEDYEEIDPRPPRRREHALRFVRKFGDPVLRTRAREINRFDDELLAEVGRMGLIMNDAIGVGLAATQLGVMHRLLVYRVHPQAPVAALVNPVIEWSGKGPGDPRGGLPEPARRSTSRSSGPSTSASPPSTSMVRTC